MTKIIILNGPNLNLLGEREKDQYGNVTLKDIKNNCEDYAAKNNIILTFIQSNIEGELVNEIQNSRSSQDGLIINAGGYTHTSVAIHDALKMKLDPHSKSELPDFQPWFTQHAKRRMRIDVLRLNPENVRKV